MDRSDQSAVSLLLIQRLIDTGAKALTASEFWPLVNRIDDLAPLAGMPAGELHELVHTAGKNVSGERVAALLDAGAALAFELERLEQSGITVLTPFDDRWPMRLSTILGSTSPPSLFVAGRAEILSEPGLGVVGSRNVDESGAEVARTAARVAAAAGHTTVSGGARGVDQLAMAAAVDAGGQSVGILADSLERALRDTQTRRVLMESDGCLATPYKPSAHFNAGNAMGRNKIIYALSRHTVVVASDHDRGGTWAGATEAMRRRFGHVLVWRGDGEGPGNEPLQQAGARPISSRDDLEAALGETDTDPIPEPIPGPHDEEEQLSLGL